MSIKPRLTLFDTSMAVVSLIIGMGIFIAPSSVAREAGSPFVFFAAWLAGGILALAGGLTFAEIGSRLPRAGGYYKIVSEVYHPAFAFMLNWGYILTSGASAAIVAIIGCKYIIPLIPIAFLHTSPDATKYFAAAILLLLFLINYIGIKTGSRVLNVLTMVKILMIVAFGIAAIFIKTDVVMVNQLPASHHSNMLAAFFLGLVAVSFTYGGYQMTMNFGGDVINPKKNMPLGIISGVIIVVILYLLINVGYYKILGIEKIAASELLARDFATVILGRQAGNIISAVIFISVLGYLNAAFMQNPRLYFALAEDGLFPPIFKKVNSKTQVQEMALIFFTAVCLFFIIFQGTFDSILNYIMFGDTLVMACVASAIFILRYRDKSGFDGFRIPLYPVLPAIYVLFLLAISAFSIVRMDNRIQVAISVGLILAGFPLYLLLKKLIGKNKPLTTTAK